VWGRGLKFSTDCMPDGRRAPPGAATETPGAPRYRERVTFGLLRIVLAVIALFVVLFLFRRIRLFFGGSRRR